MKYIRKHEINGRTYYKRGILPPVKAYIWELVIFLVGVSIVLSPIMWLYDKLALLIGGNMVGDVILSLLAFVGQGIVVITAILAILYWIGVRPGNKNEDEEK